MSLSLVILLSSLPTAAAQEAPPVGAEADREAAEATGASAPAHGPRHELEAAVELYYGGQLELARDQLIVLHGDPRVDDSGLLHEILVYLGEIHLQLGEVDQGLSAFVRVLSADPTYRLDGFVHPPEIVDYFEVARTMAQNMQPVGPGPVGPIDPNPFPETPPPPRVLTVVAPGGLQFYNQQPRLGWTITSSVAVLGVTTAAMNLWLRSQDEIAGWGVDIADDEARGSTLRTFKTVQNGFGWTTMGIWAGGMIQGVVRSSRPPTVSVAPGPTGVALVARW